ncbi:type IV toxin-antitoxin system AbiEi family antitoxin domain-containing protein [Candidatus Palauibacter sp.]|uniref:type IV toxin-antitoxin system AbiEi family antitoxin domain-containing protein n=1 Tax=Candidatus Palauibacter sp. TaxID=3101350 RepID=UPI003B5AF4C8
MTFAELLWIVGDEPVFETGLLMAGADREPSLYGQLGRWRRAGRILQLRRGAYALAPPYRKTIPHPFLVANRLVPGSYVSGLSALAFAGMIPEFVAEVTSCSPGRPHIRSTPLGRYSFRYLKPAMRWGYRLAEMGGEQTAFVATPAKAFLDLVHLQPRGDDPAWIDGLRLDAHALGDASLEEAAAATGSRKLMRAARYVRSLADDPALAWEEL